MHKDLQCILSLYSITSFYLSSQPPYFFFFITTILVESVHSRKTKSDKILQRIQLVKSPAELALMQQASTISGESFAKVYLSSPFPPLLSSPSLLTLVPLPPKICIVKLLLKNVFLQAMAFTQPGMLESYIHAKIEFECKIRGAQKLAYPPVVAAGANGLSLHYVNNTDKLK
jgi:hypothetical protein